MSLAESIQDNVKDIKAYTIPSGTSVSMIALCVVTKIITIAIYFSLYSFPIVNFLLVVCLVSVDFWTTKNLTGRKLVGLRWWIQINANDQQQWIFQSRNPNRQVNGLNQAVFWGSHLMMVVFWGIVLMFDLIFQNLEVITLSGFSFLLCVVNFQCFYKCQGTHQQKVEILMNKLGLASSERILDDNIFSEEAHYTIE